ncbi:hypothetical protein ACHAQH_000657 [Verticillium albo-atrum]
MASLNLSSNGQSIKSSYQGVINGPAPSSSSPTYGQWALFSVQAPLANAFQDSGAKESILKVQSTGDGELAELIEDFSEGRIQFAFVKVKDPNSGLPKYALIAWCGGGVPERTKGYFTTHTAAVSKILHGYHVQITARSDSDLEPESIVKKVADASGAKYSAGSTSSASPAAPPIASKPVFTPTASSSSSNPLVAARNRRGGNVDEDGWGEDAPQISRTELEKVGSAYKPTKVNMAELTSQRQEPSRFNAPSKQENDGDLVRGGYQPVGKVDIAAIRAAAKNKGDDRPTIVKGAYEPIGKVDIAAIRAKAQPKASEPEPAPRTAADDEQDSQPKSLAERSAAFSQSSQPERLTSLPKPKVANKFGGSTSFGGTKAPTPGGLGFGGPSTPAAAPVGAASRTFADQGGKTPAQLWAEKKAREGGGAPAASPIAAQRSGAPASPIGVQKSGEWKSGYSGKSWGAVQTGDYGRGIAGKLSQENTGEPEQPKDRGVEQSESPAGGVGALKDRFKDTAPIGFGAPPPPVPSFSRDEPEEEEAREPSPPPPPTSDSRPTGGFALPGLPSRPPPPTDEEEDDEPPAPPRPAERPAEPQQTQSYQSYDEPEHSPVRVAVPVARGPEPEIEPAQPPRPIPPQEIQRELPREQDLPEEEPNVGRGAAAAVARHELSEANIAPPQAPAGAQAGGKRAVIQYDYEKAEDNEIELREGQIVTNIEMVDEDWWMGTNSKGESGLFPSNYVELVEDEPEQQSAPAPAPAARSLPPPAPAQAEPEPEPQQAGRTATALFDYEAAEDNELGFRENDKITDIEFPDEDWWFGHLRGKQGLFPANYVELDR